MKILYKSIVNEIVNLEARVCSGIQCRDYPTTFKQNLFGRKVVYSDFKGIDWAIGLAATGHRCTAIIHSTDLDSILSPLKSAVRNHIPISITILYDRQYPAPLGIAGLVELVSTSGQNALEKASIAHRIAELSLCPVVHWVENRDYEPKPSVEDNVLLEFNKAEDSLTANYTPSQKILFGDKRNRVPHIFNLDLPSFSGSLKNRSTLSLEKAADRVFFQAHLEELINEAYIEFEAISGSSHSNIQIYGLSGAKRAIVGTGIFNSSREITSEDLTIGYINISCISPFPNKELGKAISAIQRLGYLESVLSGNQSLGDSIASMFKGKEFFSAYYVAEKRPALELFSQEISKKNPLNPFFIGLPFNKSTTDIPDLKLLLQSIHANYDDLSSFMDNDTKEVYIAEGFDTPKKGKEIGPPYTQLSRFRNTTMLLNEAGAENLIAEPFQAFPHIPANSSWWNNVADKRDLFPTADMSKCTGCGDCMTLCPFMAIPSKSVPVLSVLEAGVKALSSTEDPVKVLVPQIKNLAKTTSRLLFNSDKPKDLELGQFVQLALDELLKKLKWDAQKSSSAEKEVSNLIAALPKLPYAITEPFFEIPESQEHGKGELFYLAFDPHKCTGCGICAGSCTEEAIELIKDNKEVYNSAVEHSREFHELPDTSSETINRLLSSKDYLSLNALMLSQSLYGSLLSTNHGSPSQLTSLHAITTIIESIMQPRFSSYLEKLATLHNQLSEQVHDLLSNALPKEDFTEIESALKASKQHKITLDEVFNTEGKDKTKIDKEVLQRKIELNHSVQNLDWLIREGPAGSGRSRYSILMSSESLEEAIHYPENPFDCPVIVADSSHSPSYLMGLLEGQVSRVIDNIKQMRKATLEVKGKYKPKLHDPEIADLSWEQLTEEERLLIPPIVLLLDADHFLSSLTDLKALLQKDFPVKVIVFNDLSSDPRASLDAMDMVVSLKDTYQYHGSIADEEYFYEAVNWGIRSSQPALLHLAVPNLGELQNPSDSITDLMKLAKDCRVFPSIIYRPDIAGTIAQRLDISSNQGLDRNVVSISIKTGNEGETWPYDLTWSDYAYNFSKWAEHFTPEDKEMNLISMKDFLDGKDGDPYKVQIEDETAQKLKVSLDMAEMTKSIVERFSRILEISGWRSNDPKKLKDQILADLAGVYEDKLKAQKEEFEERLHNEKEKQVENLRSNLKDKLVQLANKKKE